MTKRTELIVALDFPNGDAASALMKRCEGLPLIWKVGSELFLAEGPEWVKARIAEGARIFLDLKFHDIPNTVTKSALRAHALGVEMFTLHLSGGPVMIRSVRDELDRLVDETKGIDRPTILGVSVLTSFDQSAWDEVSFAVGAQTSPIEDSVKRLAAQARYWGVDGVVCSPHELETVLAADENLYTVVPGVRPKGSATGDQARVMTPGAAAGLGASAIVVGRPITGAADPRKVVESILAELEGKA